MEVIARDDPAPACDFQIRLMSLPFAFGTRLDTVPARIPYLAVDRGRDRALGSATRSLRRAPEDRAHVLGQPRASKRRSPFDPAAKIRRDWRDTPTCS